MDLKTTLDLYEQGKANLLDIGIALMDECGTGDPAQIQRAEQIVNRDCNGVNTDSVKTKSEEPVYIQGEPYYFCYYCGMPVRQGWSCIPEMYCCSDCNDE